MKSIWIYLLLLPLLLIQKGNGRIMIESVVLVAGIGILLQLAIYAVWKLGAFRPMRITIARIFVRLPMALGFCLLVLLGIGSILAIIILIQPFVIPADSWVPVILGFLVGIMGPVLHGIGARKRHREQGADGNRY